MSPPTKFYVKTGFEQLLRRRIKGYTHAAAQSFVYVEQPLYVLLSLSLLACLLRSHLPSLSVCSRILFISAALFGFVWLWLCFVSTFRFIAAFAFDAINAPVACYVACMHIVWCMVVSAVHCRSHVSERLPQTVCLSQNHLQLQLQMH